MPSSAARSLGRLDRRAHHLEAAERVDVDDVRVRAHQLPHRRADGARNVVQLRIDERAHVARFAVGEDPLGIAVERFQPDLEDHVEFVELVDQPFGFVRSGNVERDDQLCARVYPSSPSYWCALAKPTLALPTISPMRCELAPPRDTLASPSTMRSGTRGSVKFAVPMRTARRTRQEELERVGDGFDAALADDRNLDRARDFVDREHRDRPNRRPGQAAGDVAEPRTPASRRRSPCRARC